MTLKENVRIRFFYAPHFSLYLANTEFDWSLSSHVCIYFKMRRVKHRTRIFSMQCDGKISLRFYILQKKIKKLFLGTKNEKMA